MGSIYLPESASKARQRDAENARRNRAEIVRELSWGRVSRRDLIKWGLFTSAGLLAPIGGLVAGWLADVGGTELAFAVAGISGLAAIAWASRRLSHASLDPASVEA